MAVLMPFRCGSGVRPDGMTQQRAFIVPPGLGNGTPLPPHLTASSGRLERAMPCSASTSSIGTVKADHGHSSSPTVPAVGRTYSRSPPPRTVPLIRTADYRGPSPSPLPGNGTMHAPVIDRTKAQPLTAAQRTTQTNDKVPAWARPQVQNGATNRPLVRRVGEKTWATTLTASEYVGSSLQAPSATSSVSAPAALPTTPLVSSASDRNAFDVDNSPSSTVDLHGATCLRTPSAPDSLLSGPGGLELSDSMSNPSLTISTNSSTKEASRPGDCNSQQKALPLSPIPTVAPSVAVAAPPRSQGSCTAVDLDTSIPQLALCTESDTRSPDLASRRTPDLASFCGVRCSENDQVGRRTPEVALSQRESPAFESPELMHEAIKVPISQDIVARTPPRFKSKKTEAEVGDENMPPSQEVDTALTSGKSGKDAATVSTASGKSGKEAAVGSTVSGRSGKIAEMRAYWESRMTRPSESESARLDVIGGSLRERNHSPLYPGVLRERQSEANREVYSNISQPQPSAKEPRSASAHAPRRSGADSRRFHRRIARQQQLTEDLTTLMQVVCPSEADGLARSSGSDSDPSQDETKEEQEDLLRIVERENKLLNRQVRQSLRLLTHYLKTRSTSSGPTTCSCCSNELSCSQCGRTASDISRSAIVGHQGNDALSSCPSLQEKVRPAALRERHVAQSADVAFTAWQHVSPPTSPPTVQEEEPAGEPDADLLSN